MEGAQIEYSTHQDEEDRVAFNMRDGVRNSMGHWHGTVTELTQFAAWVSRQKGG